MTTPADGSSRRDDMAVNEAPDAKNGPNGSRGKANKRAARSSDQSPRVTAKLPTLDADAQVDVEAEQAPTLLSAAAPLDAGMDAQNHAQNDSHEEPQDDGATQEVPAVPQMEFADPDATTLRAQPLPPALDLTRIDDEPMTAPAPPRPRYHTLADTFNRPRSASASDPSTPTRIVPAPIQPPIQPPVPAPAPEPQYADADFIDEDEILDEVDSEDEWALADQPTVQWTPQQIAAMQQIKPNFLQDTGGHDAWSPQTQAPNVAAEIDASHHDWRVGLPPRPRPPFPLQGMPRPTLGAAGRLAAPDGRLAPPPPSASHAGEQIDPRMERFQELRRQRFAHSQGERDDADPQPVADAVRQWWSDLHPTFDSAMAYQREARASGMHPIPAYESAQTSRLGDAFGRLAASAREISGRAQQAAAPTIKRLHDQMEQAAQGLISRFEGDTVRQQAPLLGPGRIAVFFRQGVSVGQAQRLLAASAARPMRLIPRKHGFLARVMPGKESEVCERLKMHPYVRDVVYLEFDEFGAPLGARH